MTQEISHAKFSASQHHHDQSLSDISLLFVQLGAEAWLCFSKCVLKIDDQTETRMTRNSRMLLQKESYRFIQNWLNSDFSILLKNKRRKKQRDFSHTWNLVQMAISKMWVDSLMSNGFLRLESRQARRVFTLWDILLQMCWNKQEWVNRWLQCCLDMHLKASVMVGMVKNQELKRF